MTCTRPGATTPEELVAYAAGDAPTRVADHVRACPTCAALAGEYRALYAQLRARLHRFDCPTPQVLGEYELALLGPEERQVVAAHTLECPRCAEELRTLRTFLATPDPIEEPGIAGRLRRIVATLVPAPTGQGAHAGLRGGVYDTLRTYRAETTTITIDATRVPRGRSTLVGLVWREGAPSDALVGAIARLTGPAGQAHAEVDDLGNFALEDIAPGEYQLELLLPDEIVVVGGVRVDG